MYRFNYKILVPLFALFFLSCLYVFPQAAYNSFDLFDIDETVAFTQGVSSIAEAVVQSKEDIYRFRPLFTVERYLMNTWFGYHPALYFIKHGLVLGFTLFLLWKLVQPLSKILWLSIVLFIYSSPVTIDAYWRLGATENMLTLFLLLSMYTLISKKYMLLLVSYTLLLFSKETGIFFAPVFIAGCYFQKKYKIALLLSSISFMTMLQLVGPLVHTNEGYTSHFIRNPMMSIGLLIDYMKAYPGLFLSIIVAIFLAGMNIHHEIKFKKEIVFNRFMMFGILLVSIVSILIFDNVQAYYLLPVLFVTMSVLVYEYKRVKNSRIRYTVLVLMIMSMILSFPGFIERIEYWQKDYAVDRALIRYLKDVRVTSYYIDRDNRSDHISAFEYLLNDRLVSEKDSAERIITRNISGYSSFNSEKLCGVSTLFKKSYCDTWYVVNTTLDPAYQ